VLFALAIIDAKQADNGLELIESQPGPFRLDNRQQPF
jgi:hypothetical protein